ncbi:hypothetical protein TNCV_2060201 [Trichonephila clavipes]|nr:hypothetical protein TNCV_2060201 [Trichonephila clavipes]
MIVQFRNEKVSNHGSIPIPIDCNVVAFIVFEEGFHQPIKRTKQRINLDGDNVFVQELLDSPNQELATKALLEMHEQEQGIKVLGSSAQFNQKIEWDGTSALDAPSILCPEITCLPLCIIHKPHLLACPSCYCPMPSFPPFRLRFPPPPPPPPPPSILPLRPKDLVRPHFRPHILSPQIPFPPLPPLPPGVNLLPFSRLHDLVTRKSNIVTDVKT